MHSQVSRSGAVEAHGPPRGGRAALVGMVAVAMAEGAMAVVDGGGGGAGGGEGWSAGDEWRQVEEARGRVAR